jgi:hypothetical protein
MVREQKPAVSGDPEAANRMPVLDAISLMFLWPAGWLSLSISLAAIGNEWAS